MGQQCSLYMISSRRMQLLRLLKNKGPGARNGNARWGRTMKPQPAHGLPAELKQISQTGDSSTGQTAWTCCINPVRLVYFYLASATPLCSVINTQSTGQDRLKDVINSILTFLHLMHFCSQESEFPIHLPSFLLEKYSSRWHGAAVTFVVCSIVYLL